MMTATAMVKLAMTSTGPTILGRMWRRMIQALPRPSARAAMTNSRWRSAITSPRTMRAKPDQVTRPVAIIAPFSPGPMTVTNSSATRMRGKP